MSKREQEWPLEALWCAETSTGSGPPACGINWMAPVTDTSDEHLKRNQAIYPLHLDQDRKKTYDHFERDLFTVPQEAGTCNSPEDDLTMLLIGFMLMTA
ncbi:hypothetical protein AAES_62879 [Amazona aestiva]|uniref:Uncharacterized protein n=1 Tax=Amazona aestiva TaxID=12930 RepID=A0A0Q3UTG2_AMAAE|nr:hypothetical protein AAES_62879 [Amazona aestiva]